jgi:Lrp/AsnC family transcriptional regulator, regulator for asnA, asnC and gidA
MYKIDKIDYEIITLLLEDGRMPASDIARRINGVSGRMVRYRIDRMVDAGLIKVSAVVNPYVLGFDTIADVFLEVESDMIAEVAEKVAQFDNVSYVAYSIGQTDVSVQLVGKDTAELYRFVTDVIHKIPGVRKTTTSIVPLVLKDVYQWHVPVSLITEDKPLTE